MTNNYVVYWHFAMATGISIQYFEGLVKETLELVEIAKDILVNSDFVSIPNAPAAHACNHIGTEIVLLSFTSLKNLIYLMATLPCKVKLLVKRTCTRSE